MNAQELQIKFDELLSITRESYDAFLSQSELALAAERPLMLAVDEDNLDAEKFQMDRALFSAAPVVAVPIHSEFSPLRQNGHRFLLAEDGLYLEARRPWLHFIHRLAEHNTVRIPFGAVKPKVELAFGALGTALMEMQEFGAHAMVEAPTEAAASLIWNDESRAWSIKYPETIGAATASRIEYKQVELGERESVAIDLHSHGNGPAFFSPTDDDDDRGAIKISGVFGDLDQPLPSVAFRLCVLGLYIPLKVPAEKIFGAHAPAVAA
ncbi:MAG: PRTRC system protein A [Burkholderiaceae bacterium]|nr:PRTRC system protein A [Burkholderiaceae bacterium]